MTKSTEAQRALHNAKERRDAAARELGNTAGKSRAEIHALHEQLKAAEVGLARAERQVALAGVSARIGLQATRSGRRVLGQLYGVR